MTHKFQNPLKEKLQSAHEKKIKCLWKAGNTLSIPQLSFLAFFVVFNVLFLQLAILMCRSFSRSTHGRENVKSYLTRFDNIAIQSKGPDGK